MNAYLVQVAVHSYAITPWEATYVVVTLAIHLAQTTYHAMVRHGRTCSQILDYSDLQTSMNVYLVQVAVLSSALTPLEATCAVATLDTHLVKTT